MTRGLARGVGPRPALVGGARGEVAVAAHALDLEALGAQERHEALFPHEVREAHGHEGAALGERGAEAGHPCAIAHREGRVALCIGHLREHVGDARLVERQIRLAERAGLGAGALGIIDHAAQGLDRITVRHVGERLHGLFGRLERHERHTPRARPVEDPAIEVCGRGRARRAPEAIVGASTSAMRT